MSRAIVEMMRNRPGGGTPLPMPDDRPPSYPGCPYGLDGESVCCGEPEVCTGPRAGRSYLLDSESESI